MSLEVEESRPEDARLTDALVAIANPVRLALLRQLRRPRALHAIRVARESGPGDDAFASRVISRQAVKDHLDRLVRVGFVNAREAEGDDRLGAEYLVNHQTLFALAEEIRELAKMRPDDDPWSATRIASGPQVEHEFRGPCLVLVKGLDEGRVFDLTPARAGRSEWIVGRRRGVDVALDFDPFVSTENAIIACEGGVYSVQDVDESRNGTSVNFRPLPKGARRTLRTGDLVGVGRCVLLFKA